MKTRNVRRRQWIRWEHRQGDLVLYSVKQGYQPMILMAWGYYRCVDGYDLRVIQRRQQARSDAAHRRLMRSIAYRSEQPGYWLEKAIYRQINFEEYGKWLERRWGRPHGSEHKWRRRVRVQQENLARWYASKERRS